MKPLAANLIALTEQPYYNYNTILPRIKKSILDSDMVGDQRLETFERVLSEEMPFTTARRAYQTAIKLALGEEAVREYRPTDQRKGTKPQASASKT